MSGHRKAESVVKVSGIGKKTKNSKKYSGRVENDLYTGRKKKRYLESIPEQVSSSMAFEGEKVSLKMLKEYLKTLKNIP